MFFNISVSAQTIEELFTLVPDTVVKTTGAERSKLITYFADDFLSLEHGESSTGEFKIISQSKVVSLVGLIWKNCDQSDITLWQFKKGLWKDVTKKMLTSLGKNDVINILSVSPATVNDLSQKIDISYFYTFAAGGDLQLMARKQDSCEVAGKVYDYKFNGKKFSIIK